MTWKSDKTLARLTKKKRSKTQITKTKTEGEDISINLREIKITVGECYEQLHLNILIRSVRSNE